MSIERETTNPTAGTEAGEVPNGVSLGIGVIYAIVPLAAPASLVRTRRSVIARPYMDG